MGAKDLSKFLRDYNKRKNKLSELNGLKVGVDLSVWLHQLYNLQDFAFDFHCLPPVDLYSHVSQLLDAYLSLFKKYNITMILFADGCPHPGKASVDAERMSKIDENRRKFRLLQRPIVGDPNPNEKDEITRLMKASCYTRNDILFNVKCWCEVNEIQLIGAPFETDAQEVAAEISHSVTDASCTTDSDFFVLGSKIMVDNLNQHGPTCNIIKREDIFRSGKLGSGSWDILALSCFLGNDFIDRPAGQGTKNVFETLMPLWTEAGANNIEKDKILDDIATRRKWNKNDVSTCTDYKQKFKMAYSLLKEFPVWKLNEEEEEICLEPMMGFSTTVNEWYENIGFDPTATLCEKLNVVCLTQDMIRNMYNMNIWAKTGEELSAVALPIDPVYGREQPYGSILDFEKVPIEMQPARSLVIFLTCRKLHPPDTERETIALIKRLLGMGADAPPIQEPEKPIGDGQYIMWSVVKLPREDRVVEWIKGDSMFSIIRDKGKFFEVNKAEIDRIFGVPMNGIRRRAEQCCQGGHIDLTTMKCAYVKKIVDNTDVLLLTASITPTLKTPLYWTTVMVDATTGKYLCCPYSGCDCPVGQLFCSHMLALLLYVMIIQENIDIDFQNMVSILPDPVLSLQTQPVLFSFLYS